MEFNLTKVLFFQRKRATQFIVKTLIFFCCATVFSFNSDPLFSQNTKVSISSDQTLTIYEVLELIGKQAECTFIYQADIFFDVPNIRLKKGIIKVSKLLEECLPLNNFSIAETKENYFTIIRKESKVIKQDNIRVKGKITDTTGMPLAGAHVMSIYTKKGVVTDFDGAYQIEVNSGDSLLITAIGYKSQTKAVNNQKLINIKLIEDITELGTVMINAGYYSVKDQERTGNIAKVTSEEIELQPIVSPLEALQGRIAGVEIVQPGGISGTATRIQIRGQNSLRIGSDDNGNLPLYIIDGVPVNSNAIVGISSMNSLGIDPLSTLNLSNIESVEVLKDADATAIYGSRGANGVILITTKKSKSTEQKTRVEVQLYSGIGEASNMIKLLNTEQYLSIRRKAFENDGTEPTSDNAEDLTIWDQNRYTDWQKEFFGGAAFISDVNVSISGGNANTAFRLWGAHHKEGTVLPGEFGYRKSTAGLNLTHMSDNKKLNLNFSFNYGVDKNRLFNSGTDFVGNALLLAPNAPAIYEEDGSLNWVNNTWDNPFAVLYNKSSSQVNNLVANLGLRYQLVNGLALKANMGYTDLDSKQRAFTSKKSYSPDIREDTPLNSKYSNTNRLSWIIEPQLVYNNNFGNSNLDVLIGLTFQQSNDDRLQILGSGFASESLIDNLDAAEEVTIQSNTNTIYKYNAVFGRLGYNWKRKYFLNLTARRDGSSRFGPNKRFANFGAIGSAWIFSKEDFIKNHVSFLSFGKIRGSFGITGNDQIPDYGYLDAYEPTRGPGGLYPTQLTNPDYSWEENKKLEVGVELGFFKDRINFNTSWYRNRSSNQLVGFPLPSTTGFSSIQANLPATVQNTGWELELSTLNIQSKGIRWETSFNLTIPENELVSFPDIEQTSYNNIYKIGYPLNIDLQYQYNGIDPDTGLYNVMDINEDGRYDFEDRVVIQDRGRQFYGGMNNRLTFNNFSVQFLWEFVKKNAKKPFFPNPGSMSNQPIEVFEAFQEGEYNNHIQYASQSIEATRAYSRARDSEFFMTDASFLRLKTISLIYNLPQGLIKNIGFTSGNIFLNAQNLLTITNYTGLDPQYTGGTVIPVLRTITFGLHINL